MAAMTTAERRGYQQICGDDGAMMVIACDQRGGMRSLLADTPEDQAKITNDALGLTKMDIASYLARHATAVLVDPICAVPGIVDQGVLHRSTALLIGLDASGWETSPEGYRISTLVPGIDARKVRDLGGTGAKIMVYLRSDTPAANTANIETLRRVIADFAQENLLLVVEFLTYALPGEDKTAYAAKIPDLIEGGSRICLDLGVEGPENSLSRHSGGLRQCHRNGRRRAVGGPVGRRRSRDVPRPGRNRDGKRRIGRHRRAVAVEGLHLARPRGDAGAPDRHRRPAAAGIAGGDRAAYAQVLTRRAGMTRT